MKAAVLAGLALTTLPLSGDVPRLVLEKDDVISSAWTLTTARESVSATLSLMGNDQDVGSGSVTTRTRALEVSDEFLAVAEDGSPLRIMRSFETLTTEMERGGEEVEGATIIENEGESQLAGMDVAFTYDPESQEWNAAFGEDSDGDDDWLEGLAPRLDLARLLEGAGEELEVGASWEVPTEFLSDVLLPGGEVIHLDDPDEADVPEGGIQLTLPGEESIERYEECEGDITATFESIEEEGESRLAKIVVEVSVTADLDVIDDLEEQADERGSAETYAEATLSRSLEGKLTILWNLKTNRPESIEGELSGSSEMSVEWSMSAGEMELEISFHQEVDLTHKVEAGFGD